MYYTKHRRMKSTNRALSVRKASVKSTEAVGLLIPLEFVMERMAPRESILFY